MAPFNKGDSGADSVSPEARKTALARVDLLLAWERFRAGYSKKAEADALFGEGYNTGAMLPHLYAVLGEVSIKTLYKWVKTLEDNGSFLTKPDWRHLVPAYKYKGQDQKPGLTAEEERVFMDFLLRPQKIKVSKAIEYTRWRLESVGHESSASDATFRRFADWYQRRHYDRWVFAREGQKALKDKVEPYIMRDASLLEVGQVLVADGHRLNFQILNPFTGKPCRAMMIGYLDWKSFDLVGYEIMLEENTQCIAAALRNGILRLGKAPQICYQDNGKAFRAKFFTAAPSFEEAGFYGLFGKLGITPVFSMPYNARAKVIEIWWKVFTDSFERLMPSFVGASIEDKPAHMMRNEKIHKALHSGIVPTLEEATGMINAWLEHRRSTAECPYVKGKTIGQVSAEGRGPGVDPSLLDDLMLMEKIARPGRNGIHFHEAKYWAEELYGVRDEVVIRYSLFDRSFLRVYEPNGKFICTAIRQDVHHPMAFRLGTVEDQKKLKAAFQEIKHLPKVTIRETKALGIGIGAGNGDQPVLEAAGIELPAPQPSPLPSPPPQVGRELPAAQARNWGKRAVEAEEKALEAEREVDLSVLLPREAEKKKEIVLYESDL